MKKIISFLLFLFTMINFSTAQKAAPESYYTFQDAVYAETASQTEFDDLYQKARTDIDALTCELEKKLLLGGALEELRTRNLIQLDDKAGAAESVDRGIKLAEESIKIKPSSEGYAVWASLVSISVKAKKISAISVGLKIEDLTKKALKLDPKTPMAVHLQASRYIYAPAAFRNLKKGLAYVEDYLAQFPEATNSEKFNLLLCLAHANYLLGDTQQSALWFEKASLLFPQNHHLLDRGKFGE